MSYQPLCPRQHPDCLRFIHGAPRTVDLIGCIERVPLDVIVSEALELVNEHNVTPFDAADWTAAKYNYDDIEIVLQLVREALDHS